MNILSALNQAQQLSRAMPKAPRVTETYWEAPIPPEEQRLSVAGEIATMLLNLIYAVVGVIAVLAAVAPVLVAASCWWLLTREWPLQFGRPAPEPETPTDTRPPVASRRVAGLRVTGRSYGMDDIAALRPGEEPF